MANLFEEKLKSFMETKGIQGKHYVFSQSAIPWLKPRRPWAEGRKILLKTFA